MMLSHPRGHPCITGFQQKEEEEKIFLLLFFLGCHSCWWQLLSKSCGHIPGRDS